MQQSQFENIQGGLTTLSGVLPLIYRKEIQSILLKETTQKEPPLLYNMIPVGISIYITVNLTDLINKFAYPQKPEYEPPIQHVRILPQEIRNILTGVFGLYLFVQKDQVLKYVKPVSSDTISFYRQYYDDFTRFVVTMGYIGGSMSTFYQLISAV